MKNPKGIFDFDRGVRSEGRDGLSSVLQSPAGVRSHEIIYLNVFFTDFIQFLQQNHKSPDYILNQENVSGKKIIPVSAGELDRKFLALPGQSMAVLMILVLV